MKILIDIGHPAHVHYFRNFARIEQEKGNRVLFTTRDKEITLSLLKYYGFDYISFGRPFKSKAGKVFGLLYFTLKLWRVALRFRPDLFLNATMYSAIVAWLCRKPHIALEDTYNMEQVGLYLPFTHAVLTGDYPHPPMGKKEIRYAGYQELLYLHPVHFTPDPSIRRLLGMGPADPFVIIRFVSWNASHDIGHKGISPENKRNAVKRFSEHARVFISSESPLPAEFEPYRYPLSPDTMHQTMAMASLIFGESSTMVSEGAMLGIPGIFLNNNSTCLTRDEEQSYGMVFNFTESEEDQRRSIEKGVELLSTPGIREEWQRKRERMLADKIDVTAFLVWFVENFPGSMNTVKEDPGYQERFR